MPIGSTIFQRYIANSQPRLISSGVVTVGNLAATPIATEDLWTSPVTAFNQSLSPAQI